MSNSNIGPIGAVIFIFGGVSINNGSGNGGGNGGSGLLTPFSAALDATGKAIVEADNAPNLLVGGLSYNGRPSNVYSQPYRDTESDDEDGSHFVIQVDNANPDIEGLVVTGYYWTV